MKRRFRTLADYLTHSGETQEQLAVRVGVTQPTISRAANGAPVSLRTAKKLSAATGVPVESFGADAEVA